MLEDPHAAIPTAQLTNASVIKGRWRGVARLVLTLGMSVEAPSDLQLYEIAELRGALKALQAAR